MRQIQWTTIVSICQRSEFAEREQKNELAGEAMEFD